MCLDSPTLANQKRGSYLIFKRKLICWKIACTHIDIKRENKKGWMIKCMSILKIIESSF